MKNNKELMSLKVLIKLFKLKICKSPQECDVWMFETKALLDQQEQQDNSCF